MIDLKLFRQEQFIGTKNKTVSRNVPLGTNRR